jgi:hypothetical protein
MARGRPRKDVEVLAAVEDVALPDGLPDDLAAGYVAAEMDRRLFAGRVGNSGNSGNSSTVDSVDSGVVLGVDEVRLALAEYVSAGLEFDIDGDGVWVMRKGLKEDSGNLGMPLSRILKCAELVVSRAVVPKLGGDRTLMIG